MIRTTSSWSVKQVITMINKGTIVFDHPLQRPADQWTREDESLLIDSTLRLFIPDIVAVKYKKNIDEKEVTIYSVIDGKQRLGTFKKHRDDKLILSPLDEITLSTTGDTYDISNTVYSDLHEDVQDAINGYMIVFKVVEIENGEDEEEVIDELLYRWNNGKPMSKEHLALIAAPKNVQNFIYDRLQSDPLFTEVAHFAVGAVKKSERQMSIMQSIILAGEYKWNTFGTKDVEKALENQIVETEVLEKVSAAFKMIVDAFPVYNKFITKVNLVSFVSLILNNNFDEKTVPFLKSYAQTTKKDDYYRKFCGAGGTKRDQVLGRISGLQRLYDEFLVTYKTELSVPETKEEFAEELTMGAQITLDYN